MCNSLCLNCEWTYVNVLRLLFYVSTSFIRHTWLLEKLQYYFIQLHTVGNVKVPIRIKFSLIRTLRQVNLKRLAYFAGLADDLNWLVDERRETGRASELYERRHCVVRLEDLAEAVADSRRLHEREHTLVARLLVAESARQRTGSRWGNENQERNIRILESRERERVDLRAQQMLYSHCKCTNQDKILMIVQNYSSKCPFDFALY